MHNKNEKKFKKNEFKTNNEKLIILKRTTLTRDQLPHMITN